MEQMLIRGTVIDDKLLIQSCSNDNEGWSFVHFGNVRFRCKVMPHLTPAVYLKSVRLTNDILFLSISNDDISANEKVKDRFESDSLYSLNGSFFIL